MDLIVASWQVVRLNGQPLQQLLGVHKTDGGLHGVR